MPVLPPTPTENGRASANANCGAWQEAQEIVPSLGMYWNLNKVSDDTYFAEDVHTLLRPVLDLMQTLPVFVYLLPVVVTAMPKVSPPGRRDRKYGRRR